MTKGYKYQGTGLTAVEKKWGANRFVDYRKNYPHLHKMSDLLLLEELIFQEALHERLKNKISQLTTNESNQNSSNFPLNLQNALKESIDLQFKLKEKLGLFEDKKKLDAFKDFQETEEKFKQYRKENPDLFKVTCVQCAFPFYLKRRTDHYEPLSSSWFKDRVLYNMPLFKKYRNQEPLTKKDMTEILGVSEYYIDWIIEKIKKSNTEDPVEPSMVSESQTVPKDNSVIPESLTE